MQRSTAKPTLSHAPLLALWLMLAMAVAVLWAGSRLARREFDHREMADRAALQEFGATLHAEIGRLEEVYIRDLAELAVTVERGDPVAIQTRCANVSGVRRCMLVEPAGYRATQSVSIPSSAGDRPPDISAFREGQRPSPGGFTLDLAAIIAVSNSGGNRSGWLLPPDRGFGAFWLRRSDGDVAVLVVDWREAASRVNQHLNGWVEAPFSPLRAANLVSVEGPAGALIAGLNKPPARPADFVLPLRNRLGLWQVLAWDRIERRATSDVGTLSVSATVATVLAVLAVILFRQQRLALRRAEQRVSFVNRVSHELGTPLTNALLNLDLAAEALETRPDFAHQRLRLVTEEIQRLARLVGNVLSFSRRERGTLSLKLAPCVPDEVIAAVLRQFEPALARRDIQIERKAKASGRVQLDADALAQIVGNLLSNVEKYAASGRWLGLDSQVENGSLIVRVSDHGPGIPRADRERVFEPFERVSSRVNEGASGTGLGLAIARELARRMGGTLSLIDATEGASFELRLPVEASKPGTSLLHHSITSS